MELGMDDLCNSMSYGVDTRYLYNGIYLLVRKGSVHEVDQPGTRRFAVNPTNKYGQYRK